MTNTYAGTKPKRFVDRLSLTFPWGVGETVGLEAGFGCLKGLPLSAGRVIL